MRRWAAIAIAASTLSCEVGDEVGARREPLTAYCTATVTGVGTLDVEGDYLPHVVACENGAAAFEALKAQAVAARTYLYYKLDRGGAISDGTGDQVYSCGRPPGPEHYEAVNATSGVVLQYAGETIAAFFVAGARPEPPACMGGSDDPTNTERYVTYNEGRAGDEVMQTPLGYVHPDNIYNRGCMSQNGTHCLASVGWSWDDMVRFYYGEDIAIVRTEGPCVAPPASPDGGVMPDGGAAIDGGAAADAGPPAGDAGRADANPPAAVDASVAVTTPTAGALSGGCAASGAPQSGAALFAVLVAMRRRRRSRR